jgi:hypothetical protein
MTDIIEVLKAANRKRKPIGDHMGVKQNIKYNRNKYHKTNSKRLSYSDDDWRDFIVGFPSQKERPWGEDPCRSLYW